MKYITTTQLADLLKYKNDAVIRKMIAAGKIKAEKLGGRWIMVYREVIKTPALAKRNEKVNPEPIYPSWE